MRIINQRHLIVSVAEKLEALDKENASAKDVADIIRNESWTRLECSECGCECDWVLMVGQEPDYESRTAYLCFGCVKLAAKTAIEDKGESL